MGQVLIVLCLSLLWWTSWINLTDAIVMADEGGSALFKFLCLHKQKTMVYYLKSSLDKRSLVYKIHNKFNRSFGHLKSRAELFRPMESDYLILLIQFLQINDTGSYKLVTKNCSGTHNLVVQSKPVLKINGYELRDKAIAAEKKMIINCENEYESSHMNLNGLLLPRTTLYHTSKTSLHDMSTIKQQTTHMPPKDVLNRTLQCSSNDNVLETKLIIDIVVKPELTITKIESFKAGLEVTITCLSMAKPAVDLYWSENGQRLALGVIDKALIDGKSILKNTIKFILLKKDDKTLSCIAKEYNDTKELQLNIKYGTENNNEMNFTRLLVKERFICNKNGTPIFSYRWFYDGVYITKGSEFEPNRSIIADNPNIYYCEAFNEINKIISLAVSIKSPRTLQSPLPLQSALPVVSDAVILAIMIVVVLLLILVVSYFRSKSQRKKILNRRRIKELNKCKKQTKLRFSFYAELEDLSETKV